MIKAALAVQADIVTAQDEWAEQQMALQQAMADADRFWRQAQALQQQQLHLQGSIAAAAAVADSALQKVDLLGMLQTKVHSGTVNVIA